MEKRPHTLDGRTISPKRAVSKEVCRIYICISNIE